jgi:hypothetical protein
MTRSQQTLLHLLASGPKTRAELVIHLPNLDAVLGQLLLKKKILIEFGSATRPPRYMVPAPPKPTLVFSSTLSLPTKMRREPLHVRPGKHAKICTTCGELKLLHQFGWAHRVERRKNTCTKCYHQRRKVKDIIDDRQSGIAICRPEFAALHAPAVSVAAGLSEANTVRP